MRRAPVSRTPIRSPSHSLFRFRFRGCRGFSGNPEFREFAARDGAVRGPTRPARRTVGSATAGPLSGLRRAAPDPVPAPEAHPVATTPTGTAAAARARPRTAPRSRPHRTSTPYAPSPSPTRREPTPAPPGASRPVPPGASHPSPTRTTRTTRPKPTQPHPA
ncbi:hypothetical protein GCM10023324_17980 [Streptomyces youssoufiensis]